MQRRSAEVTTFDLEVSSCPLCLYLVWSQSDNFPRPYRFQFRHNYPAVRS